MALDMFFQLSGITGESKDKRYLNWCEVLAWSWGMSWGMSYNRYYHNQAPQGEEKEKFTVQDISVTKWMDRSTPALCKACNENTCFPKLVLEVVKKDGDKEKFVTYKFKNVKVTSMSTGGSGGEDRLTENVTFSFEEATCTYYLPKDLREDKVVSVEESIRVPKKEKSKTKKQEKASSSKKTSTKNSKTGSKKTKK